jgi:hypothetical protein
MTYYIFLKSLRSLEEFRKNPHVKIPPKSSSTNFQRLGKFKNPIFNSEILFLAFGPADPEARSASGPASPPAALSSQAKIIPAGPSRSRVGPPCVDPVHGITRRKIICYSDYFENLAKRSLAFVKSTRCPDFANFALRPLVFSEINPRSMIFAVRSEIQKIFTKRSLASEKSTKVAPKLQKFISFQPQLQIQ